MSAVPAKTESPPTVRVRTLVLKGGRVEFSSPQLKEGEEVDVEVSPARAAAADRPRTPKERADILSFIESLPPGPRSAATWEEIERRFQEERDSWDR